MQNTNRIKIVTPVGRLLQGDAFTGQTADQKGIPYVYKRGAKQGQPYSKYVVVIGIEKNNPEWPEFWAKIHACAVAGMPHMFGADGRELRQFYWKYVDGDSATPDEGGRAPKDKPGFPGHHVIRFTTNGYAPKVCSRGGTEILTDPKSIKRGDYIRVVGTVEPNGDTAKPGIYVEQKIIEFIGYGPEIVTGVDPAKELQSHAVGYIPQGMSTTPLAPSTTPAVGPEPQTAAPAAPPAGTQPGAFAPPPSAPQAAAPAAPPAGTQPGAFAPPPSAPQAAAPAAPPAGPNTAGFLNGGQ